MKTLIFICILAVVAADLNAQIEKISKVLEPAVLECRYQCIQKLDTLGVTSVTDTMILRIGKISVSFMLVLPFIWTLLYVALRVVKY